MVQSEGVGSLFKGVLSPVVGLAGLNAILFVSYGTILRYFERQHGLDTHEASLSEIYIAGCGAGIASFFFSTPTDLVKIQAQMSRIPKSTWDVAKTIYSNNGVLGFYQGGFATIVRDAPSYGLYFLVYEGTKRLLEVESTGDAAGGSNAMKILLAGGLAGAVSWTSIYPLDVIKSRLQMQVQVQSQCVDKNSLVEDSRLNPRLDRPYSSFRDCLVRSYKAEGLRVFFRGLTPTVIRGFPVNAVTFWVYELVMDAMSN
ncbi:mitochondrial carrier domain-containing protein [Phycomyces blakesleeanus]|uniref:Mitochondrial carrier domain-containing protein n=1 Tax=Phycomyces blakesleeanus TaxID=4837 RepID=A0ABR3B8D4_PHYBL